MADNMVDNMEDTASASLFEPASAPATSGEEALTSRVLPQMTLSDGTAGSATGPPAPLPHYLTPEGRAVARFMVEGNAVVTGGLGALGLESIRALLEHGCTGVFLIDTDMSREKEKLDPLRREFPDVLLFAVELDVCDAEAVDSAIRDAVDTFDSLDMLVCFAGVVGCTHALNMTPEKWRRLLDVNTTGSFLVAQAVAKRMVVQNTGGSIVLTASISAHRVNFPQPQAAYNASKAAILSLKSSLAAEWAHFGIRVNSISPGYMDTVLNEGPGLEAARRTWAERNPMGRMGAPSEITGPIVLLCSDAGSYINGADLVVDGGATVF
ncbi:MAG: hypothetical protein M1838_002264 [Thelocarpon superellum]|nr:MAG: hypothetical protein M1838_002264 [Thelocarpon superellum]